MYIVNSKSPYSQEQGFIDNTYFTGNSVEATNTLNLPTESSHNKVKSFLKNSKNPHSSDIYDFSDGFDEITYATLEPVAFLNEISMVSTNYNIRNI